MTDQVPEFSLEQRKIVLSGNAMTVTLGIVRHGEPWASSATLYDLTSATHTESGTLTPTSWEFLQEWGEIIFEIPVVISNTQPLNYRFVGSGLVNDDNCPFEVNVTVNPIECKAFNLTSDGDLVFTLKTTRPDTGAPIQIEPLVMVYDYSYPHDNPNPRIREANLEIGEVVVEVVQADAPDDPTDQFVKGRAIFDFPTYSQRVDFENETEAVTTFDMYPEPLVDYAVKNMWGNPEVDSQYHLKLARISSSVGSINDFFYMGKLFRLPSEEEFYIVYSMGGIDPHFWNMFDNRTGWYPYNTWTALSTISNARGVVLDLYNGQGYMFPRTTAFAMGTHEGVTLVAIPVTSQLPQPVGRSVYLRCYTTDINLSIISSADQEKWRFGYEYAEYSVVDDLIRVKTRFNVFSSFNMGSVIFYVNGVITDIDRYVPTTGDQLEVYYDPTINKQITYQYKDLNDYYSELDSKRKLLLFPGTLNKPRVYRYFDDCDYYIYNHKTGQGFYFNRNSEDAVRQLTHQDMGIASQYVEFLVSQLLALDKTRLSTEDDIRICVCYRATKWVFKLGPCISRINDLYLLEDPEQILAAMVGPKSTIPEWSAPVLEKSATNNVLNSIVQKLSTQTVREALGYNGCAQALSRSLVCMPHLLPGETPPEDVSHEPYETGLGYRIPVSYIESSVAYEYDIDGHYLRKSPIINREWFTPGEEGYYVEFVMGQASGTLDYVISRADVLLKPGYGFRVYKAGWLIDPDVPDPEPVGLFDNEYRITGDGEPLYPEPTIVPIGLTDVPYNGSLGKPDGKWVDITGSDQYRLENGYLVWNMDLTNQVGMVVFDSIHIYNEFELTHIDKSIWFTITDRWDVGGLPLVLEPAQLDVWINGHAAIENVDYVIDFPRVYVISKMWLDSADVNTIAYRGRGLSPSGLIPSSELGFVQEGVLGMNGRYNLRIDRPTKTIVAGRVFMTEEVDWSENIAHGDNLSAFNGFPYEVKHIYCANRYVDPIELYWGFDASRDLDNRITDYLTEHVKYKPEIAVTHPYLEMDKYRLFSPFMSQLVNEMVLGFLTIPEPDNSIIGYSDQAIDSLTREYQWLLKYDPVTLGVDERFFSFQPYSNMTRPTITPNQMTVLTRVNELYLKGKVSLGTFFEVSSNV
ncbi:hypothetical protein CF8_0004 [Aeromonas phage CF8]|nr:hypothetical protein CF8_0004 [Aeromonas phage CF8]